MGSSSLSAYTTPYPHFGYHLNFPCYYPTQSLALQRQLENENNLLLPFKTVSNLGWPLPSTNKLTAPHSLEESIKQISMSTFLPELSSLWMPNSTCTRRCCSYGSMLESSIWQEAVRKQWFLAHQNNRIDGFATCRDVFCNCASKVEDRALKQLYFEGNSLALSTIDAKSNRLAMSKIAGCTNSSAVVRKRAHELDVNYMGSTSPSKLSSMSNDNLFRSNSKMKSELLFCPQYKKIKNYCRSGLYQAEAIHKPASHLTADTTVSHNSRTTLDQTKRLGQDEIVRKSGIKLQSQSAQYLSNQEYLIASRNRHYNASTKSDTFPCNVR